MRINKISGFEKLFLFLFCTGSLVFFGFFYNQHLYQKEQLQLFEISIGYFLKTISIHGGLAIYAGEFLIQFFNLPGVGSIFITFLLVLLYLTTRSLIYKITARTPLLLFSILPAIGYWIVLLNDFYRLSGVIGLLISLAVSYFYLNIRNDLRRGLSGILFIPVIYWFTGAASFVFVAIVIISEILHVSGWGEKPYKAVVLILLIDILLVFAAPLIARSFLFKDNILHTFISEAYYRIDIFPPISLIIIFLSFPVFILIMKFIPVELTEKDLYAVNLYSAPFLIALTVWEILSSGDFQAEKVMTYENLVYKQQWNEIIIKAEKKNPSDRISMVAVNLALAETGQLSTKMFQFYQKENSLFLEYERRGMTPFITGEPFYYLGLVNFAQMFAMETIESTPDAKYPVRAFKRVAETFIINGQYDNAKKYLIPLSHTLFYRRWANECISLLYNEEKINTHPYWGRMRKLIPKYDFYYNAYQMDIALQYLLLSNPGNKTAFEYLMANYLLHKDLDGFLQYLPSAEGLNYNVLPVVWQQASVYILTRLSQVPPQLEKFQISNDVVNSIKSYAQLFSAEKIDTLKIKREFGNTYWYYLHFK
jgi:Family of unknown function (DUF6057)